MRSPLDGQALTWNLQELLDARPVQRGQALLTVADLDGPWELELHVPDHRAGHVLAAREALRADLDVSFALAAEPGTVYQGHIEDVALSTELDEADGATVLVTVAFDRDEVQGLRPGATVMARIHCGRRSLGYVWLHDLVRSRSISLVVVTSHASLYRFCRRVADSGGLCRPWRPTTCRSLPCWSN